MAAKTLTEPLSIAMEAPSTAGLTTKVVKGSLWTMLGQVLPLGVAFISTPFVIRFLGPEKYGVLLLVGLIPTYFSFADFGMGIASTKFASEIYGAGEPMKESSVVWTAAAVAGISTLIVAIPLFLFSKSVVALFNVPEALHAQASIALKITSVAFILSSLVSVMNSPMLARLRMDLNTITQSVPRIMLAAVTPFVLYFGGGIVGAVSWVFIVGIAMLVAVFYSSGRLLPEIYKPALNLNMVRPLLKFGGGLVASGIAGILLMNFEKLALSRLVSVESLAFYSVAFTFAGMATMFSSAMIQSIVPAFAMLNAPEKKDEFDALFERGMRLNLMLLPPVITFLAVIGRPFFTIWAGEEFGRESTLPFYILLFGLFFNMLAYIPHGTITAKGRTDIFAKLYWAELAVYAIAAVILINSFGIAGAAAAYSLRVILDAFAIIWFSKRMANLSFELLSELKNLLPAIATLLPSLLLLVWYDNFSLMAFIALPICISVYAMVVWRYSIKADEKAWLIGRTESLFGFLRQN